MNSLIRWFETDGNALAVVVTAGIAVLVISSLACICYPSRDKDDLFRHHSI